MKLKQYLTSIAGAALLSATAITPAQANGVLKTAVNDWTGGAVMCEIIHRILETELDYKIKRIVMPSGPGRDEGIRAGDLDYGCACLLYTSPSPRDGLLSRMPSSA